MSNEEIEKYIFDPQNPQGCKTYKLLLDISKKNNLVYVDSDFTIAMYKDDIFSNDFYNKLWDKPDKFENFSINKKIEHFKNTLSEKEYFDYVESININENKFLYNKLFSNFFDFHNNKVFIHKPFTKYNLGLIKSKIINTSEYSFAGYHEYKDTHSCNEIYQGHKILFSNENYITYKSNSFFDVSTIMITTEKDLFFRESNFYVNSHIKPLILKDMKDLKLLLNVLENDLKRETNTTETESISNINTIEIKNFYSMKDVSLENLKDKKEIYIVGENGDGKTLLLQAIAIALKGRNDGTIVDFLKPIDNYTIEVKNSDETLYSLEKENIYKNIFAYGANRNANCQISQDSTGYLTLFNNKLDLVNPIEWLQYLDYNEQSEKTNVISTDEAKKLLNKLLNSDIKIDISPDGVTFSEKGSLVTFEQLSAGYKGVITIICDLISRFSQNQSNITTVAEFQGVVLIDEVELHLHPKWKYNFVDKLKTTFPLVQFILTTHSPTVILGASKEAVFYKIYKDNGIVDISNQIKNEGYTNNSLVSSPLFDMETVTSRDYEKDVSSDDYIYEKIHQQISKKIKENLNLNEKEILELIDTELDKI